MQQFMWKNNRKQFNSEQGIYWVHYIATYRAEKVCERVAGMTSSKAFVRRRRCCFAVKSLKTDSESLTEMLSLTLWTTPAIPLREHENLYVYIDIVQQNMLNC